MEIIKPARKLSFQKKKSKKDINYSKNKRKTEIINLPKDEDDKGLQSEKLLVKVRKRKIRFNSIDEKIKDNNKNDNNIPFQSPSNRKKKKNTIKNDKHFAEYLEKLYGEEIQLRKSLFRKKTTKGNTIKNLRKVSFLNPINSKNNNKQNSNLINMNKSRIFDNNDNNKTKIFNNNDNNEDQSYAYNKKYVPRLIDSDEQRLKSAIFINKKIFNTRNVKRRQTSKTTKSNLSKTKNSEKNNTKSTNNIIHFSPKRHNKSNEKKLKKRESNLIKDKEKHNNHEHHINNNKNKNNNNNNDNNLNEENKSKIDKNLKRKCVTMNDKTGNYKSIINKNKKNDEELPKKETDNFGDLTQLGKENKKKIQKQSCCFPFLVCLKFQNNEENENIL